MDTPGLTEFIRENAKKRVSDLALQYHGRPLTFDLNLALTQIEARQKCARKLAWFIGHDRFMFPSVQSSEQATNQAVARYHAEITGCRHKILDMTAGLGIDAMTLAMSGNHVTACELEPDRAEYLRHNAKVLGIQTLDVHHGDSTAILENSDCHYDWIFIDPARRDNADNRCFLLQDSQPNVISIQHEMLQHAPDVLIKASPLLDITQTLRDLANISEIHIVSYRGEVKEVLIHLSLHLDQPVVSAIDISGEYGIFPDSKPTIGYEFRSDIRELNNDGVVYATDTDLHRGTYMYEIGASIRKLNCNGILCRRYPGMKSMATGSGLFVSEYVYTDFPGRITMIEGKIDGKGMKRLKGTSLRIVSRAYPVSADHLRHNIRAKEGNEQTLYATTLADGTRVHALCSVLP